MTPEQKLNRLERIARLMLRAGQRARTLLREQGEKLNILIDAQIRTDELFAKNEERFAKNEERFARNEERFARNEERFAEVEEQMQVLIVGQIRTDEQLSRQATRLMRHEELFVTNKKQSAELNEKVKLLLESQLRNEELFARNEERFNTHNHWLERLSESHERLTLAQAHSNQHLLALVENIRKAE
jgi:hypothetical protein